MQLNKLIIEPRVRSAWAAIDLGFIVAVQFWFKAFFLYMIMLVPVFLLTRMVTDIHPLLPYFILWWCKPIFERPVLYFLSRELFSDRMTVLTTLTSYRQWLWPALGWILSIRRPSIYRGMSAPIALLEQPSSAEYSPRASALGAKYSTEAACLTIVMYHLEQFLVAGFLALLFLFLPEQNISLAWFYNLQDNYAYLDFVLALMMAVVAPFYVAAGFMLYISRRIELEGWDIEICFRDWMSQYGAKANQGAGGADA